MSNDRLAPANESRQRNGLNTGGRVIWITGLSGAGKTTLAGAVAGALPGSILLDGDTMRSVLGSQSADYDVEGRKRLAFTYARLANMLASQGFTVIVATISLFHEVHAWNRANMPAYMEVFLDVPASVRESRDPKGLYAGAKKGCVKNMAGGGVSVEFPLQPDLVLTEKDTVEAAMATILNSLEHGS